MIELPKEFVSGEGGFSGPDVLTYKQITRDGKFAMYSRERDGVIKDYEVITIRLVPAGTVQKFPNGVTKTIDEDTEKYAVTSSWGRLAWSFSNKGGALDKLQKLVTKAEMPDETDEDDTPAAPTVPRVPGRRGRVKGARPQLSVPIVEFSVKELAEANKVDYPVAFVFVKEAIEENKIKLIRSERRSSRGKETNIYSKV